MEYVYVLSVTAEINGITDTEIHGVYDSIEKADNALDEVLSRIKDDQVLCSVKEFQVE